MRIAHGAGLLLVSTTLVGGVATPAEAASVCDDGLADTTWVDAAENGFSLWDEPANWSNGVPTAESVVCIPANVPGPQVRYTEPAAADVIDATGATVTLSGTLSVGTSFDVAELAGDWGELHGPGTTTVRNGITGDQVTLRGSLVDLPRDAVVDAEVNVWDGSRLTVRGDTILSDDARVDSSFGRGLFSIAETGRLTLDGPDSSAHVVGGFANHGEVTLTSGQHLMMMGSSGEDALPDQFSTGAFTGAPDAIFWVASTELRTGARLEHVQLFDMTVPASNTATVADSNLLGFPDDPAPAVSGAGELVMTARTVADARIGGSLTATVPAGEVVTLGPDGHVQDRAHLQVFGQLNRVGELVLGDETSLILKGAGASIGVLTDLTNGPGSTVDLQDAADLALTGRFRNEGLLQLSSGSRLITGAGFRQSSTGRLVTEVDATSLGRVRAEGRRNLAGELVVQRDPAYTPPVGTVLNFITSNGREDADDKFDRVVSPPYGTNGARKLRVAYEPNRVRLWVDRIG